MYISSFQVPANEWRGMVLQYLCIRAYELHEPVGVTSQERRPSLEVLQENKDSSSSIVAVVR